MNIRDRLWKSSRRLPCVLPVSEELRVLLRPSPLDALLEEEDRKAAARLAAEIDALYLGENTE